MMERVNGMPASGVHGAWEALRRRLLERPRVWVVTGAAGFVGSHLAQRLLDLGQRVRGLDDLSTGSLENLREVERRVGADAFRRFALERGDVRDGATCLRLLRGADHVLHQAALASVPRSIADPEGVHSVNVEGFVALLAAARAARCGRVVYASSSSVYGGVGEGAQREDAVARPRSPYAATKVTGELLAASLATGLAHPPVGLRYFNLFGPRQRAGGPYAAVLPRWLDAYVAGEAPEIHGDGLQRRDFTPVEVAVRANLLAATAPPAVGGVFNCGTGRAVTLLSLEAELRSVWNEVVGATIGAVLPSPRHTRPRAGDVRWSLADMGRAREVLGLAPEKALRPPLFELVSWYAERAGAPALRQGEPQRSSRP